MEPPTTPTNLPLAIKSSPSKLQGTSVQRNKLSKYIKGYVHEDLVIQGFNNGFSLGFTGNVQLKWAENSKNVKDNEQLILSKINKEIS